MPELRKWAEPASYLRFIMRRLGIQRVPINENFEGTKFFPPGHFHSPLLDLESLSPESQAMPFDGPECWETVDLQAAEQKAYFLDLLTHFPVPTFPATKTAKLRYYEDNTWFRYPDAFTLAGIIRKEKPARIIEVGSGFSTAVILDTLESSNLSARVTCIEPFPERLHSLLTPADLAAIRVIQSPVQSVPLSTFDELKSGDLLFIDSSHVAKVGSDVTHLFLRVLPRLQTGVIVQLHDIFHPYSYRIDWIRRGWAWNESLFLRAFLIGNPHWRVMAFNEFAGHTFPEIFRTHAAQFLSVPASSFWMRKV